MAQYILSSYKKKSTATKPHLKNKMQTKHTVKAAKCWHEMHFCLSISGNTVEVRHQPIYWMVLITATIPVIKVMEAILATEIWMVPIIHCHSFCLWPVWIISPERTNTLILVKIVTFYIVPSFQTVQTRRMVSKFKRELKNLREDSLTGAIKHDHLKAINNCWLMEAESIRIAIYSRLMKQNLAAAFSTWIICICWLYLPSMSYGLLIADRRSCS